MSVGDALAGARLHLEALALLRRQKRLWPLVAVPFVLSALAFAGVASFVALRAEPLHRLVSAWLPDPRASVWWQWIWIGPAQLLLGATGWALFAAFAIALLVAAFLLASVVAAPFLDALSRRVEQLETGRVRESDDSSVGAILREGGRALLEEGKRIAFFLALQGAIVIGGMIVPGAQAVAPVALVVATMLFLPLDHASFVLDRWQVPFRSRRRWLLAHAARMLGFGASAFVLCGVPVVNFLALPLFVTSGTLLALRVPPPEVARRRATPARAPGAESSTSP